MNELSDRIGRIATIGDDPESLKSVIDLIRESQYIIESVAPNLSIDEAAELVDLGRVLSEWKYRWIEISTDSSSILKVRKLARDWYEHLSSDPRSNGF